MSNKKSGIVRVNKRANSYTVLDTFFLTDERLSWKAKGLLGYLLSKPDNWRVYVTDLVKRAKDGRDSVYSTLRELEAAGYIERHRIKDEKGRITGMETVVYERPLLDDDEPDPPYTADAEVDEVPATDSPQTEIPDVDKPNTDSATLSINDLNNIDFKVIDRLSAQEHEPILRSLSAALRQIQLNDTVTLYDAYFDSIYAALCRQFPNCLEPELIRRAGDIYISRTIDDRTLKRKLIVHNPVGLFVDAYKDAISEGRADRWKKTGG